MLLCIYEDGTTLPYEEAASQNRLGEVTEVIFTGLKQYGPDEFGWIKPEHFSSLKKITIKDSETHVRIFQPIPSLEEVEFLNATISFNLLDELIKGSPKLKQIKRTNTRYDSFSLKNSKLMIDKIERSIQRINESSGKTDLPDDSLTGSEYGDEEYGDEEYEEYEDYPESDNEGDDEEDARSQGTDNSEELLVGFSNQRRKSNREDNQSVASSAGTASRMLGSHLPTRARVFSGAPAAAAASSSNREYDDLAAEFTVTKDYALRSQNVEGSEVDLYSNPDSIPDSTIEVLCRLTGDDDEVPMTEFSEINAADYGNIVEMRITGNGARDTNILNLTDIDFSKLLNLEVLSVADASIASDPELNVSEIYLPKLREVHIGKGCAVNFEGIKVLTDNSRLQSISFEPGTKRAVSYAGIIDDCDDFEDTDGLAELEVINYLIGDAGKLSGGYSDELFEDYAPEPAKKTSATTPIKQTISCRLQGDYPGQDVRDYTKLSPAQRKKITTLTITGAGGASDPYPNVMNAVNWSELSQLQHLDLIDVSLEGRFSLSTPLDAKLFPNLQTVEFTRCGLDIDTLDRLARTSGSRLSPFKIEECFAVNEDMETELDSKKLQNIQKRISLFHTDRFREEEPTEMARTRTFAAESSEPDVDRQQGEELNAPAGITIVCRLRNGAKDEFWDYTALLPSDLPEVVEIKISGTGTDTNIITAGINWSDFPNVTKLTVDNASLAAFRGDTFAKKGSLPNLVELAFGENTAVNEEGIRAFATMAPGLKTIEWEAAEWAANRKKNGSIDVVPFFRTKEATAAYDGLMTLGSELQGVTGGAVRRKRDADEDEEEEDSDLLGERTRDKVSPKRPANAGLGGEYSRGSAEERYVPSQSKPIRNLGSRQGVSSHILCKTKGETSKTPYRLYDDIPDKENIDFISITGMSAGYNLMKDSHIDWSELHSLHTMVIQNASVEGSLPEGTALPNLRRIIFEECEVDEDALNSFADSSGDNVRVDYDGSDREVLEKVQSINNRPNIYYELEMGSGFIKYNGNETEGLKNKIKHLYIDGKDRTRKIGQYINLKDFKNLEELAVMGVTITDDVFEDGKDEEVFPYLKSLEISGCNVGSETLLSFANTSTSLISCQMSGNKNSDGRPFTDQESQKIQNLAKANRSEIAKRRGHVALIRNMVQHRKQRASSTSTKVDQENEALSGQKHRKIPSSTSRHALFGDSTNSRSARPTLSPSSPNTARHTTKFRGARVDSTYHTEREELRTLDDIKGSFLEGLQEIDKKRKDNHLEPLYKQYKVEVSSQDNLMRLNYKPETSFAAPIKVLEVDANTDTTTVYKNWSTQVDPDNKHISLEEKALIVLHSLGIPPCPPDIKISNETSDLAKAVRAQFRILLKAQNLAEEAGDETDMTVRKINKSSM